MSAMSRPSSEWPGAGYANALLARPTDAPLDAHWSRKTAKLD